MAETTGIAWTDSTFNPWMGCTKVGPGCDNCYASVSTPARTLGISWGPGQPRRRTSASNWDKPLQWNKRHAEFFSYAGRRQRVFCASLSDVFDNEAPSDWRDKLFALIRVTPHLDWLLLTKRIGNVARMAWPNWMQEGFPDNIWLGITVVNQEEAERDIPKLLAIPARTRFLSIEPMLGPISLDSLWNTESFGEGQPYLHPLIGRVSDGHGDGCGAPAVNWVICGGESGPNARPMQAEWATSLRDQCAAAGVAFFMKQMGGESDKRGALDDIPEHLRIRCFP